MSKNFTAFNSSSLPRATKGKDPQLFEIQINNDEKLLTKSDLAEFFGVSIKTIDRWVSMNEIPYLKVGRSVRFCKKAVLIWAIPG